MGLIEHRDLYLVEVDGLDYTYKCLATVRTSVNYDNGMCFDLLEDYTPPEIYRLRQGVAFVRHERCKKVPSTYTATYKTKGYDKQYVPDIMNKGARNKLVGKGALKNF